MLVQVEGEITDDLVLPANTLQIASFRINRGGCWAELPPFPQTAIADMCNTGGFPWGYVIGPDDTQDQTGTAYQLAYYEALPSLSESSPQNWLILREPGLYLYGALAETAAFLRDDGRIPVWESAYQRILDGMHVEDGRARYGVSPVQRLHGQSTP